MKIRSYIQKSYKRQLQLYFIASSVIPIAVSGFLLVGLFRYQAQKDLSRQDLHRQNQIASILSDAFALSENGIREVAEDPDIAAALISGKVQSHNVYAALYRKTGELRDFATADIYSGGKRIYSTGSGTESRTLPTDFGILAKARESKGKVVYRAGYAGDLTADSSLSIASNSSREPCIQIAEQIQENEGYAVVTIRKAGLDLLLQGSYGADEGILVMNRFWEPVYSAGALADRDAAARFRGNLLSGQPVRQDYPDNFYSVPIGATGLTLVYLTAPALSAGIFHSLLNVVLFFSVLMVPLGLLFANYMSRYLSRPIAELGAAMRSFRHGDMNAQVHMDRDDELGLLAEGFNKTTVRLRENIEEQIRQQKQLNETKIRMLQAQLNPHFLYNTLDTIKWVGIDHQVPEVAQLSQNLAVLLRQSISNRQFITLSEELDMVENYCNIQEFRFGYSFSYECEVPEDLMRCIVPKLILQPVVENAIIHGLEGVDDGLVKVSAARKPRRCADNADIDGAGAPREPRYGADEVDIDGAGAPQEDLEIIVVDNGHGISDEMIDILARHDAGQLSGHLGFRNVDTILRMFYGDSYGIHASRRKEGGTQVSLLLPATCAMIKE